jgi:hypothetical protein
MKENKSLELGTILFLIFLVLKLTNNISWSWWWVTSHYGFQLHPLF